VIVPVLLRYVAADGSLRSSTMRDSIAGKLKAAIIGDHMPGEAPFLIQLGVVAFEELNLL
jgi:hypothetical protein